MRTLKINKLTQLLIVAVIVFCCGCKENRAPIKLTSPKTAYSILTIIADQKGMFADEGLNIEINYVNTGKIAMDDLLADKADIANIVETNIAFAGLLNAKIEVFASIEEVYDAGIVARKDKGINSPQDLRGKKLGVLLSTTSQVFADRFLAKHSISKDSVEMVNLLPAAMQSAIIEGSGVDAISIWQPYIYNTQKALGADNQVTFNDTEIFTGYMTLAGSKSFSEKRSTELVKVIRAYIKAQEFVEKEPIEAKNMISSFLNLPMEVIETIWSMYKLEVSLKKDLIENTTGEGKWIIETQEAYRDRDLPNYSRYFNSTYLNEALGNDQ